MREVVEKFLESKKWAWAPSTMKVEASRLTSLSPQIDGSPERLWGAMQDMAPYTRSIAFGRVVQLWGWAQEEGLVPQGVNPYKKWRQENARQFKNTYERRLPKLSMEEALERIGSLPAEIQGTACSILRAGLRISEVQTASDSTVLGKGNKRRALYSDVVTEPVSPSRLRRALKKVGLKPHDLRKIAATEYARRGLDLPSLMKMFGWSSLETAKCYWSPLQDEEIRRIVNGKQELA